MTNTAILGVSTAWLLSSAWSALIALVVLIAGWILAKFISRNVLRLLPERLNRDHTIVPLLSQVVRYGILVVTIIVVLGQFGVETASILAVLGAAGLAIALALQGTLSNIAAGILLVLLRPFNVGDQIDADGIAGTVVEIGLFGTQMRNAENVFMFVPNSKLSNARITNFTREPGRIVELKFTVPRSADLGLVRQRIIDGLRSDYAVRESQAEVVVDGLTDTAVSLAARIPVRSSDWAAARSELQERLKLTLDREGGFAAATA